MRYFFETLMNLYEFEQQLEKGKVEKVFQVVLRDASHIKRFTWLLLQKNINFKRSPLGSGITIFHVDTKVNYFMDKEQKV